MIASAKAAFISNRDAQYGIENDSPYKVNMASVRKRKQNIVESFRESSLNGLKKTKGLDLLFGKGKFIDSHTIEIQEKTGKTSQCKADMIFINTGCRPMIPSFEGIERVPYLDSTSIMDLGELPKHLVIIGGGYISLEFGQMFRRFGSEITILARGDKLLKREDPDISEELKNILEDEGIKIRFQTSTRKVSLDGEKNILVNDEFTGTHLLVATGRTPNTEDLQLETAGIEPDKHGFIQVNEKLQTIVPHIYAIGDVKGGPAFTHVSYDDYRIIRDNLFKNGNRTTSDRYIPYTVFTDPQLARVGLSEEEARLSGIPYKVAKIPMSYVARAIETGEAKGFMKAVVHAQTGEILGCAILGAEGGELMSMLEIAMIGKITYQKLQDGIFAHPTLAEGINTLFASME